MQGYGLRPPSPPDTGSASRILGTGSPRGSTTKPPAADRTQIGASIGLSSTSSVAYQLAQLEERGLISRTGRDWSSCQLESPKPPRRGLRSR
ncbi:hypothetical protein ACFCXC_31710 [Streptomyces microflavus]